MIASFKHRGLRRLHERGDARRIPPHQRDRIGLILADLAAADRIEHMRRPGYRLHSLHGSLAGLYAVEVSGNWRIVFRFIAGKATDIDLIDYH